MDEPRQPRQRKVPRRYEVGESVPVYQKSVTDTYKLIYYEVIDYVVQAITTRFDQKGYKILSSLETMLCNEDVDFSKFDDVLKLYQNDFRTDILQTQLQILHSSMPNDIKSEKGATKLT